MRTARLTLPIVFLAAAALLVSACADEDVPLAGDMPPADRPNVILILADDLGYGDLGSYGQQEIQTPHLDRMAREGIRFTQFYAGSTVCAPSRSALLTGYHTGHTPIRGNREVLPIGQAPLPDTAVTVAEVLQQAGYATAAFGKWGLGAPGSEGMPSRQGFDRFFGYLGQRRAHFYYPEFLFEDVGGDTLRRVPLEGNRVADDPERHPGAGQPVERAVYAPDRIMEEALRFVSAQSETERPFFVYLPTTIPHAELLVPDSSLARYLDAGGASRFDETPHPEGRHYSPQAMPQAAYAAMVTHLDGQVGRLLDTLEARGMADDTIVLFTSDNGPHSEGGLDPAYFASSGPLRGIKRDLYEGGIRVPLVAWGPGRVPAGATSDTPWAAWDLLPTLAELGGIAPGEGRIPPGLDGVSMAAALTDGAVGARPEETGERAFYWEFYEGRSAQAVRKGRWKAVRIPMMTGPVELYDLEADPGETTDVAGDHPEVVAEMEAIMAREHAPSPTWVPPASGQDG